MMTISQFLLRLGYTRQCPKDVNPLRWKGMLKWFETRKKLGESYERVHYPRYE